MDPPAAPSLTERLATALTGPGFLCEADFIGADDVARLAAASGGRDADGQFHAARVGAGAALALRPDLRGDRICWLAPPHSAAEQGVLASLESLRVGLNRTLMLGLESLEVHYARYGVGRGYARHLDRSPGGIERVVTVVLYLNAAWGVGDGGELVIATPGGDVVVPPRGGTLVVFLSERFEHEVRAARRERLSLTGWFSRRACGAPIG